jgi:superoxide dismutase
MQALEPHISKEIMTLHHTKHHQTYVNGLNAAEESFAKADVKEKIKLQSALKFNGGGASFVLASGKFFNINTQVTSTTHSSGRT